MKYKPPSVIGAASRRCSPRPRSKAAYRRLVDALDAVLDAGGADESHELARLANYVGDLVREYEAAQVPIREMPVRAFLRELMKQRGLTQKNLPGIGAQSEGFD